MKKILIFLPPLTEAHHSAIAATAARYGYEACFCSDAETARTEAADAEILFSADVSLPGLAPQLKWLCVSSAGVEPYLPSSVYANPEAILSNSSGAYGVTISEHIIMVTLEMMRRQQEYRQIVANREWIRNLSIRSICGSRVTLLGAGDIGRETAMRLRAFKPRSVIAVNRSGRDAGPLFDRTLPISELDGLLSETDLLIMSLPGTPETNRLMDARRLSLLPADAFLVNVGRGNAVDEDALLALMKNGHLSGAALDVFIREPIPTNSPLWECPRLLITTHTAGNMTLGYTVDRIVQLFLEDFENFCAGKPLLRQVDRTLGY